MKSLFTITYAILLFNQYADCQSALPAQYFDNLVLELGSKSFVVREAAARNLIKAGSAAIPALSQGLHSSDPEVSQRSRQLLPLAADKERHEKIAALLSEPFDGPIPKGLASAERFLKITGDTKSTRQLFAEMMLIHHDILEAMELNSNIGNKLMNKFCNDAYERWDRELAVKMNTASRDVLLPDRSHVALLLFVRSDSRFLDDRQKPNHTGLQVIAPKLKEFSSGPDEIPGMQKLFFYWLSHEKQSDAVKHGFHAANFINDTEALKVSFQVANDKSQPVANRAEALMAIPFLTSGKDVFKYLSPLLVDKSLVGIAHGDDNTPQSVQIRDVAMGIGIELAQLNFADYGFEPSVCKARTLYTWQSCRFSSDSQRNISHAKWKAWLDMMNKKKYKRHLSVISIR